MAMKILIGYDGSVDADGALHDLALAGLPAKAEVRVITATTPWVMFGPEGQIPPGMAIQYGMHAEEALRDAKALAGKAAASLRRQYPGWAVRPQAILGDPAQGLLEIAERWKPALIVMGSHGRSALGRMLVGSTSLHVLHHAPATVRITRPRLRLKQGPPRVLVAVDGSPGSDAALAAVASRAWPKGSRFLVVGSYDFRPNPGVFSGGAGSDLAETLSIYHRAALEKRIASATDRLTRAGLSVQGFLREGDPRSALLAEAKDWAADCIFLGSRGAGTFARILLGSVSSAVASHAPCTVEVVRARKPVRRGRA
jgi:nucleotide-binding universal stress UspA family protein